jgi:hypothetical protein
LNTLKGAAVTASDFPSLCRGRHDNSDTLNTNPPASTFLHGKGGLRGGGDSSYQSPQEAVFSTFLRSLAGSFLQSFQEATCQSLSFLGIQKLSDFDFSFCVPNPNGAITFTTNNVNAQNSPLSSDFPDSFCQ